MNIFCSNEAFNALNLEWFALPGVAGLCLDVGGIQFPMAPFSAWYSSPEIATRDFMDKQQYDYSEVSAIFLHWPQWKYS